MNEEQYETMEDKNNRMKLGAIFIIVASLLGIVYDFGFNRRSGLSSSVNKLGLQDIKIEQGRNRCHFRCSGRVFF